MCYNFYMMNIYNFTQEKLEEYLIENGFKKYNASQIIDFIYKKKIYDFNVMSNLSLKLREVCNSHFEVNDLKLITKEESKLANKYLFELSDGDKIECVVMFHDDGNSLCISSQVGCNMGCAFCESGRLKKVRNLLTYEMVNQIISVEKLENIRIDYVVVMGIGEPFDNYDNIIDFLSILTNNHMVGIGSRHITVSTCGLVPKIYEFANLKNQVNLAISLHAPNNVLRDKLMKINHAYKIEELIKAIDYYISITNRRVTIEYIMLDGINDTYDNALELVNLFKGKLVYINLIPYNETSHFEFKRSSVFKINKFYDILKSNNINVTIRKEMGGELSAACGQLRALKEGE